MTVSATATSERKNFFDFRTYSQGRVEQLASEFKQAEPFPHLVIEDFLNLTPDEAAGVYPTPDWPHWNRRNDFYQSGKMYCRDTDVIPPLISSMFYELSSPPFLRFLESVTGIGGLIPDPYYEGGGLHCSGPEGVLMPHTDFHYYGRLKLYRRINLLLYLNPGWEENFGGCLELWEKGANKPAKLIVPDWGTCVIFRTDDHSVHGFSTPIKPGHWRRSVALYYYSSQEAARFSGDAYTYWQQHGTQGGLNRLRICCYRLLARAARKLSHIAHQANPNKEPR
ncbi:MAG TPA: 2OG-Fe(II) oxygenase [Pyrinomonadaceae bacterium]|jgi:Rps23 Pro-64 3,4-dihydroxylase Tpa1-like proline 4-hydroxylase